ncbi:MAG: phosphodiester glycosidase family protein, partial [Octadecabacter sp.]|nr:phosphodiester glycosidase family protein [Octadecabacter sp.]
GSFAAVEAHTGRTLAFAMNAGMYHDDRDPVGHYIEDGIEEMRVISSDGPGNFGLLPNGVFCIGDGLRVHETLEYLATKPACTYATQSGPMLVIGGALHPRFLPDSDSRFIRNGVGTSADGSRAVFAISNEPVTFHDFGTLFRDTLALPDALFFDGKVSRLYAPALNRSDFGFGPLGPMVGVLDDGRAAD